MQANACAGAHNACIQAAATGSAGEGVGLAGRTQHNTKIAPAHALASCMQTSAHMIKHASSTILGHCTTFRTMASLY